MDKCADNSTDCLLRLLIQQSAGGSPWDAPTFGFTVAIGILAFFVSWVTVFQGLFAAGPGRLKASAAAIGEFSKLTKIRLSWLELAIRSTASVPIITTDRLIQRLDEQKPTNEIGKHYGVGGNDAGTAASWLRLLRTVGIEEDLAKDDGTGERDGGQDILKFPTDFLPNDVTAPPAAIQLSTLALLAAIADRTVKIEVNNDSLQIAGELSQVSFRMHPILGSLAAYERYETGRSAEGLFMLGLRAPTFGTRGRCTKFALELARGVLQMTHIKYSEVISTGTTGYTSAQGLRVWTFTGRSYRIRCTSKEPWALILALTIARTDYEFRPFPWRKMEVKKAMKALWKLAPVLHKERAELETILAPCEFVKNSHRYKSNDAQDVLASALFESRGSWVETVGTVRFFSPFEQEQIEYIIDRALAAMHVWVHGRTSIDVVDRDPDELLQAFKWVDMHLTMHRAMVLEVYESLSLKLEAKAGQSIPSPTISSDTTRAQDDLKLSSTSSAAFSPAEISPTNIQRRLSGESNISPGAHINGRTQNCEHQPLEAAIRLGFETLLLIRAILFAECLQRGPDTSVLFGGQFRDPIVKML